MGEGKTVKMGNNYIKDKESILLGLSLFDSIPVMLKLSFLVRKSSTSLLWILAWYLEQRGEAWRQCRRGCFPPSKG